MAVRRKGRGGRGEVVDVTVDILRSIRDGVNKTNDRIDALRVELTSKIEELRVDLTERIDQTNARLDQTNARLDQHEKALVKLIDEVGSLGERFDNFLQGEHRRNHEELRARVERLEEHAGLR